MDIKEIVSKKILTESKGFVEDGYTHTLNPYSGCAFSCIYCFVRELPIQTFKEMDWGTWLEIKTNAAELYKKEIKLLRKKGKPITIFMASATDPYQPMERTLELTRSILQAMLEFPPDFVLVQTRSPLVTRDIDLLLQLKEKCGVRVSMTVETDRDDIKQIFAPKAPGLGLRIKALREIKESGIATQAAVSPVLPFTKDFPKVFEGLVDRICIDTLAIGDGAKGKRSERLGMPDLFSNNNLSDWYRKDIHLDVVDLHLEKTTIIKWLFFVIRNFIKF
jgi:DNA repair photolyase